MSAGTAGTRNGGRLRLMACERATTMFRVLRRLISVSNLGAAHMQHQTQPESSQDEESDEKSPRRTWLHDQWLVVFGLFVWVQIAAGRMTTHIRRARKSCDLLLPVYNENVPYSSLKTCVLKPAATISHTSLRQQPAKRTDITFKRTLITPGCRGHAHRCKREINIGKQAHKSSRTHFQKHGES
jgi:hypothetical protein